MSHFKHDHRQSIKSKNARQEVAEDEVKKQIQSGINMVNTFIGKNEAEYMVYSKNTGTYGRSQWYLNGKRWGDLMTADAALGLPDKFKKHEKLFTTDEGCEQLGEMVKAMASATNERLSVNVTCNKGRTRNYVDRITIKTY